MSEYSPTEISLHQKSRLLRIRFVDGQQFEYPFEYLRVHSRAADHRTQEEVVTGKEQVNIVSIEPEGSYGLRIEFDDGHDTGSFAFETLYQLGLSKDQNWATYLQGLKEIGYERQEKTSGSITVTALPFAWLARLLDSDEETLVLPEGKHTVADAMALLKQKPGRWNELLQEDDIELELNDQPINLFTTLSDEDEFTIYPKSGEAPKKPE